MVSLLTRSPVRNLVSVQSRQKLKRCFARALKAAGYEQAYVCLSLSGDTELHELNQKYANEDHPTDVLSFSQSADVVFAGQPLFLGDVIVSVETALRQAQAAGHSLFQELLHLSVHGLCHLLGYDHATSEEEQVMFGYEAKLREQALHNKHIRRVEAPPKTKN